MASSGKVSYWQACPPQQEVGACKALLLLLFFNSARDVFSITKALLLQGYLMDMNKTGDKLVMMHIFVSFVFFYCGEKEAHFASVFLSALQWRCWKTSKTLIKVGLEHKPGISPLL